MVHAPKRWLSAFESIRGFGGFVVGDIRLAWTSLAIADVRMLSQKGVARNH